MARVNLFFLSFFIVITGIASCDLPHHHRGASFITDPGLDLFGANLDRGDGRWIIKSCFQSSIIGRTEYVYENLDIDLPGTITAGSVIDAAGKGIRIWYAKGGQGGQMESAKAKGSITVLDVSDTAMRVKCELEFSGFTAKGHPGSLPDTIRRKGTLTARKGYRLY